MSHTMPAVSRGAIALKIRSTTGGSSVFIAKQRVKLVPASDIDNATNGVKNTASFGAIPVREYTRKSIAPLTIGKAAIVNDPVKLCSSPSP
jgi:hypothetical protein